MEKEESPEGKTRDNHRQYNLGLTNKYFITLEERVLKTSVH